MTRPTSFSRRLYSPARCWLAVDPYGSPFQTPSRVGITSAAIDGAAEVLGVELPPVRSVLTAGEACGTVRTTAGSVTVYAPTGGMVTMINDAVRHNPSLVIDDPYGAGWLFAVLTSPGSSLEGLTAIEQFEVERSIS